MKLPIVGSGYLGRSTNLNASRSVNFYPVVSQDDSKSVISLVGTPGLDLFVDTALGPVRGWHVFNGVLYVVIGAGLYSISAAGVLSSQIGNNLSTSAGRVLMSDNGASPTGGDHLLISDGTYSYVYYIGASPWIDRTVPASLVGYGQGLVWSGTTFCGVGGNGQVALVTTDGTTYTQGVLPTTDYYIDIAWNDSVFCTVANNANGTVAATSANGVVWGAITLPAAGANASWSSIAAKGGRLCVVANGSNNVAYSDNDGANWSSSTITASSRWESIAAASMTGRFCAVSASYANAAVSANGIAWTDKALPAGFFPSKVITDNTRFLAIGANSVSLSANGDSWTEYSVPVVAGQTLRCGAWTGNYWLLLASNTTSGASCYASATGANWTACNMALGFDYRSLAWNGSVLLALGSNAGVATKAATSLYGQYFDGTNLIRTDSDVPAYTNAFLGGYFVADIGGGQWAVSGLYDGLQWSGLDQSTADASPGNLLSVYNNHGELWLFGERTTEIWYQSGGTNPPFARVSGGVIDYGLAARYSVAQGNNTIFWLANKRNNDSGQLFGIVMASGYSVQPISTEAINYAISQYSTVSDAWAYTYTADGHEFYVITFPTANATWAYDTTTGLWHERSSYKDNPYKIGRHLGDQYAYFSGKHLLADYNSGKIYEMSSAFLDDDGDPICSIRTASSFNDKDNLNRASISKLQLDCEAGVGITQGTPITSAFKLESVNIAGIAWDAVTNGKYMWVTCYNNIHKIDVETNVVLKTIASTGNPAGMVCAAGYLWVTNAAANTVSRVNPETDAILTTITGFNTPVSIAYDDVEQCLWVANFGNDTVSRVSVSTLAIVGTVSVGVDPAHVFFDGQDMWVVNSGDDTVSRIDTSAETVLATIAVGSYPHEITKIGDDMFVANTTGDSISKIARSSNTVTATFSSLDAVYYLSTDGTYLYAKPDGGQLLVIDPSDGSTDRTITISTTAASPIVRCFGDSVWVIKGITGGTGYNTAQRVTFEELLPSAVLSWSTDGGHTWSNDHPASMGKVGEYSRRVIWRRLGASRDRIFRVAISDAVKKVLLGAYLDVDGAAH